MNTNNYHYRSCCLFFCRAVVAAFALALPVVLPSCTDDPETSVSTGQKGGTATLELSLSVPPMLETKATVCEAAPGSEARKAGFYYEMQVSTAGTPPADSSQPATRAATSLKNIYAFLFKADGSFNGRASLESAGTGNLFLVFSDIADLSAAGGRLVVVANDGTAAVDYTSSTDFAAFSGTYTEFLNLELTSNVTKSEDIPYVGTADVTLAAGIFTTLPVVNLYRMLAEIRLTNETFTITGGPTRYSIDLYRAGKNYFGTPAGYDGTGTTATAAERYLETAVPGENANGNTWYVGENIQSDAVAGAYIRLASDIGTGGNNRTPAIGEEYYIAGGSCFTFDVYINDVALRRNAIYNITVSVKGNLAQITSLAGSDPNVTQTSYAAEHAGLNIGKFGGASGYTTGAGEAPTITGTYTKYLLLQPNTSGTAEVDNDKLKKLWSIAEVLLQPDLCRYWDCTYTSTHMEDDGEDKSILAKIYCHDLTIGGVDKGTWYVPTIAQLMVMWEIREGITSRNDFQYYSGYQGEYWSASEFDNESAIYMDQNRGYLGKTQKYNTRMVRCVRDL